MISTLILAAAIAASTAPEPKEGKLFQALGYAMFAAKAGDTISTHYGLQAGLQEANPLMENEGARIAASVAVPALVYLGTKHLHKKGYPTMALWMRIGVVGLWSFVTANNLGAFR